MEVNVALNFEFDDANFKTQVADAFQAASQADSKDGIVEAFSSLLNENAKSALENLVNENRGAELLRYADIRALKTKISFECVAPHEDEEFVKNFMEFITILGGKPLTSKITGEQGEEYIYKFTKGKMSVTYKEPDDEDW